MTVGLAGYGQTSLLFLNATNLFMLVNRQWPSKRRSSDVPRRRFCSSLISYSFRVQTTSKESKKVFEMCKGDVPPVPTDANRQRVAVIGGGVSGLAAAWHLHTNCENVEVQLFEAEDRLGGHAYTVKAGKDGVDVDIGFMVFNHANYPNMTEWFKKLNVDEEDSDMSLSVSLDGGKTVEWNSDGLNGLLARRKQAMEPSFYQMIRDMGRFHNEAPLILQLQEDDPRRHVSTGQYLRMNNYSEAFGRNYLLPMMAALWSASMSDVLQFPAVQLISFLCNHKMLQMFGRPQWKTVANRSQAYTKMMQDVLGKAALVSTPILEMRKLGISYELFTTDSVSVGIFDQVIFACHPPTARKIIESASMNGSTPELLDLLGKVEYADNKIYVHSDPKCMPLRRRAWASWNCLGKSELIQSHVASKSKQKEAMEGGESGFGNTREGLTGDEHQPEARMKAVYVTYWLNRLQNLKTEEDIFVSLNPHDTPAPELTHHVVNLAHPQFKPSTLKARKHLSEVHQGNLGLWFAGAWQGYGFHEDGCRAGFEVATKLSGVPLPWATDKSRPVLSPPDLKRVDSANTLGIFSRLKKVILYDIPVAIAERLVVGFMSRAIQKGCLRLKLNDGRLIEFGDGSLCGSDSSPVTIRVFDMWMFVKIAWEYDLGLARSYMAGHFVVEPLADPSSYDNVLRPLDAKDETNTILGDPVGLTRLLLLIIGNRDLSTGKHVPAKSSRGYSTINALNAGVFLSKIGSFLNFLRYRLTMDNSERGGSLKNIHAHYDLSNDLFRSFLDKETLMYSSAIYDAVRPPSSNQIVFRGSLEEAQWRKLDTLLDRAQVQPGMTLLDIGFGWGGLSIHAAKKYGCRVTGITLSVEQKALAEERVAKEGVAHLVTFEVIDYRIFARRPDNLGRFDRVLSCEMIEAVGHDHLPEFFWAVEQVLAPNGVLVMEAITTTEARYEQYRRTTDFINTVIFPGSLCPSLHALVDAAYHSSALTLEHIDNIGLHYAQTLAEWRRRFNAKEATVRGLGFDDVFLRVWNYYLSYCEAGFYSRNVNCLILVFARNGCNQLASLYETRSVTQAVPLSNVEVESWLKDS